MGYTGGASVGGSLLPTLDSEATKFGNAGMDLMQGSHQVVKYVGCSGCVIQGGGRSSSCLQVVFLNVCSRRIFLQAAMLALKVYFIGHRSFDAI